MTELAVVENAETLKVKESVRRRELERLGKSGLVPEHLRQDRAALEYTVMLGEGLGLNPAAAVRYLHVFPTKGGQMGVSISAQLYRALAYAAGHHLHVEADFVHAKATLIRKTTPEDVAAFQLMREESRRSRLASFHDTKELYDFERQRILDQISALEALDKIEGGSSDPRITALREKVASLYDLYDLSSLRTSTQDERFDLAKQIYFESVWTVSRAQTAGYTRNELWKTNPQAMLTARSTADVVRNGASEVLLGVRTFMESLGITGGLQNDPDREFAMDMALYIPEELEGEGRIEVIDASDESRNRKLAILMDQARKLVEGQDDDRILAWASTKARDKNTPAGTRSLYLQAVRQALRNAGRGATCIPFEGTEQPLEASMTSLINTLA